MVGAVANSPTNWKAFTNQSEVPTWCQLFYKPHASGVNLIRGGIRDTYQSRHPTDWPTVGRKVCLHSGSHRGELHKQFGQVKQDLEHIFPK